MAATPKNGQLTLTGAGGQRFLDFYVSDVVNALVTYSDGSSAAGSASPTEYTFNADGVVTDISIATGLADTTNVVVILNGTPTGSIVRWANFVNTIASRPFPGLRFKKGGL